MDNDTLSAVDSMARIFTHMFKRACGFEDFEGEAMDACMDVCAAALAAAFERFDRSFLDGRRPARVCVPRMCAKENPEQSECRKAYFVAKALAIMRANVTERPQQLPVDMFGYVPA